MPCFAGKRKFSPTMGKVSIEITGGKSPPQSGTNLDVFGAKTLV